MVTISSVSLSFSIYNMITRQSVKCLASCGQPSSRVVQASSAPVPSLHSSVQARGTDWTPVVYFSRCSFRRLRVSSWLPSGCESAVSLRVKESQQRTAFGLGPSVRYGPGAARSANETSDFYSSRKPLCSFQGRFGRVLAGCAFLQCPSAWTGGCLVLLQKGSHSSAGLSAGTRSWLVFGSC